MPSIMTELALSILRPLGINGRRREFSRWEELDHVLRGEQAFFVIWLRKEKPDEPSRLLSEQATNNGLGMG
jgi:hypothetical protein